MDNIALRFGLKDQYITQLCYTYIDLDTQPPVLYYPYSTIITTLHIISHVPMCLLCCTATIGYSDL